MGKRVMEKIRSRRKALGISQADLCHAAGVPERTYQDYEAGKRQIPVDRLEAITKVLGCSVSDLYDSPRPSHPKLSDLTRGEAEILKLLQDRLPATKLPYEVSGPFKTLFERLQRLDHETICQIFVLAGLPPPSPNELKSKGGQSAG